MSITNTATKQQFAGNGAQVAFPFTISFFSGEDVIKVYIDGVLQGSGFSISESTPNDLGLCPGGTVTFSVAPADQAVVLIQRESPRTQTTEFSDTYNPDAVEIAVDKAVMLSQELDEQGTEVPEPGVSGDSDLILPDWETATEYVLNQLVYVKGVGSGYDDYLYRCIIAHTSTSFVTDFGNSRWERVVVKGVQGPAGPAGAQGPVGPAGADGADGSNGAPGADGVFSEIASQGEAEAGVDNTKGMTALRVKQAIDAQVPNYSSTISTIQNNINSNDLAIQALSNRVSVLEAVSPIDRVAGAQRINNNQLVPVDIDASAGEGGAGGPLRIDADGAHSARVEVEVYRKDDAETRFVQIILLLQYIDGTWYIARESTTFIVGDFDGLTFSLNQVGEVVTVQYTSDNMAGGNYSSDSRIRYLIQELNKNF